MKDKKSIRFIVCDSNPHAARLVAEVLRGAGFDQVTFAADGAQLLALTAELQPDVAITASRIPIMSGLDFTRKVREGHGQVRRTMGVIVMTETATQKFLEAARNAGVDEMLVRPFSGQALLARVEAVLLRPRRFVESLHYVGPCRRRRMLQEYGGSLKRFTDPFDNSGKMPWEAESNRELVKLCVSKISQFTANLSQTDRRKLREIYATVAETEQLADDVRDQALGDAARSLGRYIAGVGARGALDPDVVATHIDAMQKLSMLGSDQIAARDQLVKGLVAVVDKRLLRRAPAAAAAV